MGSGAYFEGEQKTFLIINENVSKCLASSSLTHSCIQSEDILWLTNQVASEPHPVDVAINRILEASRCMVKHLAMAISASRFANKHKPSEHELLFFHGFSGIRA